MKVFVTSYNENYIDEDIKNYKNYKYHFRNNDIKLALIFNREDLMEDNFAKIVEQVQATIKHGVGPKNIVITFYNNFSKKVFGNDEIERMKLLRESFKKMGVDVRVYDYQDAFTIEEVESASQKIKDLANNINMHKLSPLEKLLFTYLMVSDRDYTSASDDDSSSKSRSLFSILNNEEIVCAGYSTFLKTLADELKDPNIKVFCNMIVEKDEFYPYGFHQNNIVYLKDTKYNIDGFFYLDPTRDSDKIQNPQDIQLKFFMIPINEIKNINDEIVDYRIMLDEFDEEYGEDADEKYEQEVYSRSESRIRDKNPNSTTLEFPIYSSLSNSTFRMEILKKNTKFSEESLYQYLTSREDFNKFAISSFLRLTKSNKKYQAFDRKKAYWYSKRFPHEFYGKIGIKRMWNFMKKHTDSIDMGQILNALREVLKANFPYSSKDEIAKIINEVYKNNVESSKKYFNNQSQAPFPMANYNVSPSQNEEDTTMDK